MNYKNVVENIYLKSPELILGILVFIISLLIAKIFQFMINKLL